MSFVDLAISQRHFRARYVNVGRGVDGMGLAQLAAMACVDIETATAWADEIDREIEIAGGGSPPCPVGIAGGGGPPRCVAPGAQDQHHQGASQRAERQGD